MQSRDDDVTLSADIVEKWLDSNVDWLARYLEHRKPFQNLSNDDVCESATASPNDLIATGARPGSSVTATSSTNTSEAETGAEAGAAPIQMPFVRTRSTRGSQLNDSSCVRRSTSWTRKELTMSRDNGLGNTTSSPNLIVLTGDCCPAIQQQAGFANDNPTLVQSEGCQNHHHRSNSKKHLRYDFARSRVGRGINGKTASSRVAPTHHHQQQQQHQPNAASATTCNNGNGGNGTATLTAEPSFASFDGQVCTMLDLVNNGYGSMIYIIMLVVLLPTKSAFCCIAELLESVCSVDNVLLLGLLKQNVD